MTESAPDLWPSVFEADATVVGDVSITAADVRGRGDADAVQGKARARGRPTPLSMLDPALPLGKRLARAAMLRDREVCPMSLLPVLQ